MNQEIAKINNLAVVQVAMDKLVNRQTGLPALGVIYGPSGYGKTTATTVVANEVNAYYIQMRSVWTRKVFLQKLCLELGLPDTGTITGCADAVTEQLAASQRPLIIDEADYAAQKAGFLELIRDIYEGSQVPVILVGEEMLPKKLKKHERFHGRVLAWVQAQPASIQDTKALAQVYAKDINISDSLFEKIAEMAHGSVRRVMVNLVNIAEYINGEALDVATVENIPPHVFYTGDAPKRGK